MKKSYILIICFLLLLIPFSSCGESSLDTTKISSDKAPDGNIEIKQSSISILNMSDLDIIKKTSDYLKSCGENLTFQETEITYLYNKTETTLCKNKEGENVYYQGDYLQIKYYPHPRAGQKGSAECLVVFLGEGGKVLGYCREALDVDVSQNYD